MKSLTQKEQMIELRAQGFSFADIATKLDISKQTALNWAKELGIEIKNAQTVVKESFMEKLKLGRDFKLRLYKDVLERLEAEFKTRSFEDLSTQELLNEILRIEKILSDETSIKIFNKENAFAKSLPDFNEEVITTIEI